ncbi:MAG: lipopolysaccharide biosynthesis protein [Anaerolineales bacterium]|nr:lipopolysaccharide biosynthesis protein [Anaerolineales bacterium]NUQ83282.1 lipopolysaccharide biosynthesis protein [Anaerolineales bacterium]
MIQKIKTSLGDDPLIRRVLRNSGYLFSSNTFASALGVVQGILVVRLLGDAGFGLLVVVMDFASNVNRLLSFRMSEVTVKYAGEALAQNDKPRAASLIKGIGMTEALTSVLAYLVLLLLSVWGARTFADDASIAYLFRFYGLFLLANLVYETSIGVLHATDNFKRVAQANFYQSVALTLLITAAFLLKWNIAGLLAAYLIGKTIAGFMVTGFALRELNGTLGRNWTRAPLALIPDWKPILRFAFSTNLNGTVNLFARDNVRLYLAALLSTTEVGYFALASRLINLVMLPLEPFIWPTYAEITKTVAQKQWQATRKLLKQISAIGASWTLLAGGGLAAIGWWLIPFIYGSDMAPAYPCFLILLLGYGVANVANWNRPLLLALGKPNYPLMVAAIAGAVEVALIFLLVPRGGYLVGAGIVSGYFIVSITWIVLKGLSILKRGEVAT